MINFMYWKGPLAASNMGEESELGEDQKQNKMKKNSQREMWKPGAHIITEITGEERLKQDGRQAGKVGR